MNLHDDNLSESLVFLTMTEEWRDARNDGFHPGSL